MPPDLSPVMKRGLALVALAACLTLSGCAGGLQRWIVGTRDHQGDLALANRNFQDASLAYRLALQLDPRDEHAKLGLANVQLQLATLYYQDSKFEDALAALALAAKYDPQSVRVAALRSDIEQARIKRELVFSNYPSYQENVVQLRRSYDQLRLLNAKILQNLKRFDYTYDTGELTKAIRSSYELSAEVARLTNRLATLRQLVEAGAPATANASARAAAPGASLLPLP